MTVNCADVAYARSAIAPSSIDRSTPIGIRDAAIILLGYASALRRSELVALTLADVEHKPAGLLLTVRRSKTDQPGHGQVVAVAHGRYEWAAAQTIGAGPIHVYGVKEVAPAARRMALTKTYRDNPALVAIKVLEAAGMLTPLESDTLEAE